MHILILLLMGGGIRPLDSEEKCLHIPVYFLQATLQDKLMSKYGQQNSKYMSTYVVCGLP